MERLSRFGEVVIIPYPTAEQGCYFSTVCCHYYDPVDNCWKLCCAVVEVCPPKPADCAETNCGEYIIEEFDPNTTEYVFSVTDPNVDPDQPLDWTVEQTGEQFGSGTSASIALTAPEDGCITYTIRVIYVDATTGLYKACCKEICICRDAEECILATPVPVAGGIEVVLDDEAEALRSWYTGPNGEIIPFGEVVIIPYPTAEQGCYFSTVCCHYYDPVDNCWKLCCAVVEVCPPKPADCAETNCGEYIIEEFDPNTTEYVFSVTDPNVDPDQPLDWTVEQTGEQFGSGTSASIALTAPEDGCITYTIRVIYVDATTGLYKACCKEICICRDAEECILATPVPVAGGIEVVLDDEAEALRSWYTGPNGEIIPFGEVVIIPYPTAEQGCYFSTVCCHYYDPVDNCWKLCCAVVEVCPPKPADCAETNCGEYIIEEFDPNTTEYVFSVTDPNVDPDQPLDWTVEQTGEQFGSSTSASIALTAPEDGCITYTIRVIYVDATTGLYKACCKEICICRDAEECILATPVPVAGGIEVVLDDEAEALRSWYTGPNGEIIPFGEVVIIPYPTVEQGCYFSTVCCHYYDPVDNCWKLCCAVVEVCPPKPADCAETNCGEYIIEEFDPNTTEYVFSVTDPNVDPDQPLDWTVEETGEQFGSGTSASIALTAPEDGCITYTIRVIYVDATTGLYKACCKEICICRDAEECILATPVPVAGGIEVVLDDEAEALRSWYTGPNGEIIPFGEVVIIPYPTAEQGCYFSTVCCHYYDPVDNCWKLCCAVVEVCPPAQDCNMTDCNDRIVVQFDELTGAYLFSIDDPNLNPAGDFDWMNETTGEQFGSDAIESLMLEAPEDGCTTYLIKVSYNDLNGQLITCCKEVCICRNAENCTLARPVPVAGGLEFELDAEAVDLRSWYTGPDGDLIPFGDRVFIPYPTEEEGCFVTTVCCHYYDVTDNCWKLCCSTIEICPPVPEICNNGRDDDGDGLIDCDDEDCGMAPSCDPNCPRTETAFTIETAGLNELMFIDQSTNDPELWIWEFGDGTGSEEQFPNHTYAEPGTYEVCLTAANFCGFGNRVCQEVVINPIDGFEVIIDIEEMVAETNTTIELPVILEDCINCSEVTAFQGQVIIEDPSVVQVVDMLPKQFNGVGFSWYQEANGVFFETEEPINVPIGDTLFMIALEVVGNPGDISLVSFSGDFEVILAGNYEGEKDKVFELLTTDGLVTILDTGHEILGNVLTMRDRGINEVKIPLLKAGVFKDEYVTDQTGDYKFEKERGGIFTVKPYKSAMDPSAVNVIASTKVYDHLSYQLGLIPESGSNPYQIIAMDVDCDDRITVIDSRKINQYVLGIDRETFEECAGWAFVPADYEFQTPEYPFPYPDSVYIPRLDQDVEVNFIGIMKGDVEYAADPTIPGTRLGGEKVAMDIVVTASTAKAGDTVNISFVADHFQDYRAYQMALQFDPNVLQFMEARSGDLPNIEPENFGLEGLRKGEIRTLWVNPGHEGVSLTPGQSLFELSFVARQPIDDLSEMLSLGGHAGYNFAFDANRRQQPVRLTYVTEAVVTNTNNQTLAGYQLLQNQPNPFAEITSIGFDIPKSEQVQLVIYNHLGQMIQSVEGQFSAGRHYLEVNLSDYKEANQLLYYQLKAGPFSKVKKMLIIH